MTTPDDIEPGIRPLVDALNQTGLVCTFSSCEGHFNQGNVVEATTLPTSNRQAPAAPFAYVKFVPAPERSDADAERLLTQLLLRFKARHGFVPVRLLAYKQYVAVDEEQVESAYVVELRPFNRQDPPATQRQDTDRAIAQLTHLLTTNGGMFGPSR